MAFAVKNILEPMALLAGGFTGIGIIAKEKLEVPLWVSNVVLNIPVFLVAFICLGRKFVINSLVVTAAFSIAVGILPQWNIVYGDIFLSTVLGGILMGAGLGLVLLTGASSGGVDMISVLVNRYKKNLSVGFHLGSYFCFHQSIVATRIRANGYHVLPICHCLLLYPGHFSQTSVGR